MISSCLGGTGSHGLRHLAGAVRHLFPYRRRADGPRPCGARRYGSGHRYAYPCLPPPFSSAIPRIRLSSTWSPKSVSLRPRPCRISTMNVFPSCSFRFGNRFPYPWSQPRNFSGCRARAAEWAAICLDRRGDRLFGGRSPDLALLALSLRVPCGSAKRRRTPRKISRRNAGTAGQVCTPRFFRTSSHGNLRCFGLCWPSTAAWAPLCRTVPKHGAFPV